MATKRTPEPARVRPIIPLLPYQREDIECPARFRWNCWSRQSGKSFTKSLRRILRGITRRRNQIFLSAGERQSRELMDKARRHCQALQMATAQEHVFDEVGSRHLELGLPGGVRIIGLPANPMTARGYTGDVLLDEFAMHADDREIWSAMFPTLLRGDGELDVASTPRGRGNMFFRLRENPRFSHSTVTLPEAIAQWLRADAEEIRQAMGDDLLYRQEFLCEFLDEGTAFLTYEQIAACVNSRLTLATSPAALQDDDRALFLGVDIGRHRDLTVLWVLAREKPLPLGATATSTPSDSDHSSEKLTTVAVVELSAAPFRVQYEVLCEWLSLRQVRRCCMDAGGLGMQLAEQAAERFGAHRVEGVCFTPALKSQLAGGLRIAVENRRIVIPPDERIARDWHGVERTLSEAGHFRLASPRSEGSHADRFWAAALAVHAANEAPGAPTHEPVRVLTYARKGIW